MNLPKRIWIPFLFGTLLALPDLANASDDVTMNIAPAFDGYSPRLGTVPVAVEFQNSGPDTSVVLHVDDSQFHMVYPLELPRGASKRLITYPTLDYGSVRYVAQTNRGTVAKNYEAPPTMGDDSQTVLMISDIPGELSFLRGKMDGTPKASDPQQSRSNVQDAYSSPLLAPDRPVGYTGLSAVILGAGAERLRDEQVSALKTYVMLGGALVFIGGASAPLLNDPRWQDVLPAHEFHVETISDSSVLGALGGEEAPRVSLTTGTPIPGAIKKIDHGLLATAERNYGIGRVTFIAFNPFEAPLSRWDGRRTAMMKLVRPIDHIRSNNFLNAYAEPPNDSYSYGISTSAYSAGSGPIYPSSFDSRAAKDPFSIKLPDAGFIFTVLAIYFCAVIPANFLILRKLKRGELAWFTAPVLSLIFAAEFFTRASSLYSASLSTATQGIIIAQQGDPNGMFVGRSQMFIPHSGTYDLKLAGVDSLDVENPDLYRFNRRAIDPNLNAVDVGEIRAPHMPADNLAFREMSYRQFVPEAQLFSIEVTKDRQCTVRNTSPYRLYGSQIIVGGRYIDLGALIPGGSRTVPLSAALKIHSGPNQGTVDPMSFGFEDFTARGGNVALVGTLKGYRPGPQLGTTVENRTDVRLALVAKEALGPQ